MNVPMSKSLKRMLALMGEDKRKVCQPVMYAAEQTYHVQHLKMLRRKGSDKEEVKEEVKE